jgi:hypothetical protein
VELSVTRRPGRGPAGAAEKAAQRTEETTRLIARALRHAIERGRFSRDEGVEIVLVQLFRPGGPALRLSEEARASLREAVGRLGAALDPTQPRSVLAFARAASEAAWHLVKDPRHPGAAIAEASGGNARELARAAVWAEAAFAKNSEDHLRRAVTRALRERKKGRGLTRLHLEDEDPLRAMLDVPTRGKVVLPRTDVRARIASAAEGTPLGAALRLAARFSEELVRPAIGEELWSLARPVGFADKAETKVLVEVRSALTAHEVQLRSQELAHRLRALPGFARVQGVKIVVVEEAALKVVPRPRGS